MKTLTAHTSNGIVLRVDGLDRNQTFIMTGDGEVMSGVYTWDEVEQNFEAAILSDSEPVLFFIRNGMVEKVRTAPTPDGEIRVVQLVNDDNDPEFWEEAEKSISNA